MRAVDEIDRRIGAPYHGEVNAGLGWSAQSKLYYNWKWSKGLSFYEVPLYLPQRLSNEVSVALITGGLPNSFLADSVTRLCNTVEWVRLKAEQDDASGCPGSSTTVENTTDITPKLNIFGQRRLFVCFKAHGKARPEDIRTDEGFWDKIFETGIFLCSTAMACQMDEKHCSFIECEKDCVAGEASSKFLRTVCLSGGKPGVWFEWRWTGDRGKMCVLAHSKEQAAVGCPVQLWASHLDWRLSNGSRSLW